MNNMTLYQLTDQYNEVLKLFESDEFDQETLDATLDAISGEIQDKGVNIANIFKNLDATTGAISDAIKQLSDRKKSIQSKQDKLKEYLLVNMQKTGITKIESPLFDIKLAKNPPSVEVLDENLIPESFKKTKTIISIDKTEIKKAGGCDGAKIVNDKQRVVIK